ncbi:MAG: anti-sigma factor family protein [Terriglobales bacterium]
MNSCQEFTARISEFLDGELEAASRQLLAEHARACPACSACLASLAHTVRMLGDESLFAPPEGAGERLHASIDRALAVAPAAPPPAPVAQPAQLHRALARLRPAWMLAAALVLIALGGFEYWQQIRVRTWQGWLIDAHCAVKYEAAGKLPASHPRWCTLEPPCQSSGYGVYTVAGRFQPFDPAGSRAAVAMLQVTREESNLRVTVQGRERSGVIHPLHLALDPPAHSLSVHGPPVGPPGEAVLVAATAR